MILHLIYLATCAVVIDADAIIYSKAISITAESSFMNYVKVGENEKVTECSLTYPDDAKADVTHKLDLDNEAAIGSTGFTKRIISLGRKTCGIKFIKYTENDPKSFNLLGTYLNNKSETSTFNQTFTAKISVLSTIPNPKQIVNLGDSITITCAPPGSEDYIQVGCTIINPQAKTIFTGGVCNYVIRRVTLSDIGIWKCVSPITKSMEPLQIIIEIELKAEPEIVKTSYREENNYGIISCKLLMTDKTVEYCLFTRPDGHLLTVTSGGASDRYTSFGTNLNEKLCEIGFKLPHTDNEIGSWGCNVANTGGFIAVKSRSLQDYPKYIEIIGNNNSVINILCKVPYSTDQCFIQAPDGSTYVGGDITNFNKGECIYNVQLNTSQHFGNWTCHYSQLSSAVDDIITVNVVPYDNLTPLFKEIEVDEGDSATILCKSRSAIHFCRFVDPNGNSYHVSPDKPTTSMSYFGKGLNYGECGILINNIKISQAGSWTCTVRNGEMRAMVESSVTTKIIVSKSFITTASSIGLPVGIMSVAIILLAVAMIVRFRKKNVVPPVADNISISSDESINNVNRPINNRSASSMYTQNPFSNQ